jgi:membrane fusion protein (multidrug efflux system)
MTDNTNTADTPTPPAASRRRRSLIALAAVVGLAGVAYGGWYWLFARHYEDTDNAYVQAHVVQITPQVGGTVESIDVEDTDFVKAGQTLVKLDPADAQVALDQAEAQLGQTVREVRTLFANVQGAQAQVAAREADLARVQADLARAQDDVDRRAPLVAGGAVGQEEFRHAQAQLAAAKGAAAAARSAVAAAREQQASAVALTQGTTAEDHPNVKRAAARVREAHLALQRAALVAPVDGWIARRNVQLGQRVQAGAPLMSVVALGDVWVDANFKESQLQRLRIGQPAELHADVYGKKVVFHGKVAGLGAGTGSAFSLLPAQNATGNWIKIVQRVPVRIELDPAEVQAHPLRVGLSMLVDVDVADQSGKMLADTPRQRQKPEQLAEADPAADALVQRVIDRQLGKGGARHGQH